MVSVGLLLVPGWSKECEDVGGPFLQGPSEGSDLGQAGRDSMGEFGDHVPRQVVGRVSSCLKVGMVALARPRWTSRGRFQAMVS